MGLIVTTRHMRSIPGFSKKPGFCVPRSRQWAERQGLDWRDFVRNGIEAEKLLATGDGFAIALVEWARKCEAREQGNG